MTDPDWLQDPIASALAGQNPTVLARMPAGFAVIGLTQFLPGYCLLLSDDPSATRLSDLDEARQAEYLRSMATLARAVEVVCAERDPAFSRVNIEILGNLLPVLHAHIWPRYAWEPADLRTGPVWHHPRENWRDPVHRLGPQHDDLRAALVAELGAAQP